MSTPNVNVDWLSLTIVNVDDNIFLFQPVGHPKITAFCTELTGITQDMLESCPAWSEVLSQFVAWYQKNNLTPETATFATCGLWDFATCLPGQCSFSGTTIPTMLDVSQSGAFVNVKFYNPRLCKLISSMLSCSSRTL